MRKAIIYDIILISLIILEALLILVFNLNGYTSQALNSVAYFAVTFLFGVVALIKFYNKPVVAAHGHLAKKKKYTLYIIIFSVLIIMNHITIHIFKTMDYRKYSDIIPAVEILVKRLLTGQNPYDAHAMEPLYYKGPSNYLSMHWLPFSIAGFFHFDYRSVSFSIWCFGALYLVFRSMKTGSLWIPLVTLTVLSGCYMLMAIQSPGIMGITIEMMIAGYYMLFIAGLNQKNTILTGLFIAVCLLSRYYVVLWLPLAAFVLLASGNKRQLLRVTLAVFFFLLVLYVIPFLSKDWSMPFSSFKNYEYLPLHEWYNIGCSDCKPAHLYNGTGFAYLFYEKYIHTDLNAGYQLLKTLFYRIIFFIVLMMGIWYWFNKKRINYKIFLMASFKIYLSVFLSFILLPYLYLMITALFVSIAIFAEQASYKQEEYIHLPA